MDSCGKLKVQCNFVFLRGTRRHSKHTLTLGVAAADVPFAYDDPINGLLVTFQVYCHEQPLHFDFMMSSDTRILYMS